MTEPTPREESGDDPWELNCLIEGESTVFVVTVGRDVRVSKSKEIIKSKREEDTLKDVGAHNLALWKVGDIVASVSCL